MRDGRVWDFSAQLQYWRRAAHLTQERLAERSGLSPRSIQNLERGRVTRPRRDSVRLLADALELRGAARAEFEYAARLGTPTPITEASGAPGYRGVTDTGRATLADNLRQLIGQTRTENWRQVDLRGLTHVADPGDVLARLLVAIDADRDAALAG